MSAVDELTALLVQSRNVLVFTGAGLSTGSGIDSDLAGPEIGRELELPSVCFLLQGQSNPASLGDSHLGRTRAIEVHTGV